MSTLSYQLLIPIRLNELDMANQQYINEMTVEFEKCQAMEKIRIEFFVETLRDYLNYVDVSKDARLVIMGIAHHDHVYTFIVIRIKQYICITN